MLLIKRAPPHARFVAYCRFDLITNSRVNHPIRIFRSRLRNLWMNIHEISVSSFDLFGTGFDLIALDSLSYRHARSTKKCFQFEFTSNAVERSESIHRYIRIFACRSAWAISFSQKLTFSWSVAPRMNRRNLYRPDLCWYRLISGFIFLLHPLLHKSVLWFCTRTYVTWNFSYRSLRRHLFYQTYHLLLCGKNVHLYLHLFIRLDHAPAARNGFLLHGFFWHSRCFFDDAGSMHFNSAILNNKRSSQLYFISIPWGGTRTLSSHENVMPGLMAGSYKQSSRD